jgi:hypothetical protein
VSDDGNASDFIRSQPTNLTAPDVVDAGRRAGFDFSTSLVYAVRGRMKKGGSIPAPAPGRRDAVAGARRPSPAPAAAPRTGASNRLEGQIQELVDVFVKQMAALVRRAALDAVREALERGR